MASYTQAGDDWAPGRWQASSRKCDPDHTYQSSELRIEPATARTINRSFGASSQLHVRVDDTTRASGLSGLSGQLHVRVDDTLTDATRIASAALARVLDETTRTVGIKMPRIDVPLLGANLRRALIKK